MNKQIKELAVKSGFELEDGGHLMLHHLYVTNRLEKFAEEVIQDCLAIIDICRYRNGSNSAENKYADMLQVKISKYFDAVKQNVNTRYDNMRPYIEGMYDDPCT